MRIRSIPLTFIMFQLILAITLPVQNDVAAQRYLDSFASKVAAKSNQHVGTFFYPWYGHYEHWNEFGCYPPLTWASNYLPNVDPNVFDPSVELYDSMDESIIRWQLRLMKRGHIEFAISSWWGIGTREDLAFRNIITGIMLRADNPYPELKWCIYYEKEYVYNPAAEQIVDELEYVTNSYGSYPSYFRINEKPVIFVYGSGEDTGAYAQRWKQVRETLDNVYIVLKVFDGYENYVDCADGWHQYAPANRYEYHGTFSAYASPGFWAIGESPRLARDLSEFEEAVSKLANSGCQFLLIETWNEWHEGTSIEPGQPVSRETTPLQSAGDSYGTSYIDVVAKYFPAPTPTSTAVKEIVSYEGDQYDVVIRSDSDISDFDFNEDVRSFAFKIESVSESGFCSIAVPKQLLSGTPIILLNGVETDYILNQNTTHYFTYFTYSQSGSISIILTKRSITCNLSSTSITIGSSVTISGTISPAETTQILIQIRPDQGETWDALTSATSSEDGTYSYEWTPTETASYQIKALYRDTESSVIALTVKEEEMVIPGFPVEATLLGIVLAAVALALLKKKAINNTPSNLETPPFFEILTHLTCAFP